jgi:oligopeptide transport system permease protein
MARYIVRRLLAIVPLLWAVATATFFLMHAVPGGPFDAGDRPLAPAVRDALHAKYHLDESLLSQYCRFMAGLAHGDLGISFERGREVTSVLADGLATTVQLGICAFFLALVSGVALGVGGAVREGSLLDHVAVAAATAGSAIPNFVVATVLVVVFALELGWFDTIGWELWNPRKMVLPSLALALFPSAFIARITRASMLEVLRQDYIRTARSKGLGEAAVVLRHALRSALHPVLIVSGPILASLVTGSFVIERTFAIAGVGTSFVDAVLVRDYGMIMGSTLLVATAIAVANLLVDFGYAVTNPRVRYT